MILWMLLACGPDFAPHLLMDREKTVATLIDARFDDWAQKLVPNPAPEEGLGDKAGALLTEHRDAEAIALYAKQAALGDSSANVSLLIVSRMLLRDPSRLQAALADPLSESLISLFAYTRGGFGTLDKEIQHALDLIVKRGRFASADVLAAALYRYGRVEEARRVSKAKSALIAGLMPWVEAKLALFDGKDAEPQLQAAAAMLKNPFMKARARAELATLILAKGDYLRALPLLLGEKYETSFYYQDAAYVAERLVSAEQLDTFLDNWKGSVCGESGWPQHCLPQLLARRALREGNYTLARKYTEVTALVERFEMSDVRSNALTDPIARAELLFWQATRLREHGMELRGTEWAPDWKLYDGAYRPMDALSDWDEEAMNKRNPTRFMSAAERSRCASTAPQPNERFHYRQVAAALSEHAADLVPARSQAYAALLCHAMRFGGDRIRLYSKYVKHGAIVDFSMDGPCPVPEFSRAQAMASDLAMKRIARFERWAPRVGMMLAAGLILASLVGVFLRRMRRNRPH